MNASIQKVIFIIFAAFALATPQSRAQNDDAAIRDCFKKYQLAIGSKNGRAAAALVNKATISYFGGILNNALYSDEAKVRKLDSYRKMMVLLARHELGDVYRANGYSTNATEFFALLVGRGYVGQTGANLELGKISRPVDIIATAPGILNGQQTPANFVFEFTKDGWKFGLLDVILKVDKSLAEKRANSAIREDDAIIQSIEARSGRSVSKDIWKPIRAR